MKCQTVNTVIKQVAQESIGVKVGCQWGGVSVEDGPSIHVPAYKSHPHPHLNTHGKKYPNPSPPNGCTIESIPTPMVHYKIHLRPTTNQLLEASFQFKKKCSFFIVYG